MSENKPIKIKRKIEIPKLRLWLIWMLLFVFPTFITTICFYQFRKEFAYFAKTDLISDAYEKIRKYNESIVPENFLESQLEEIQKLDTSKPLKELKSNIDSILCGKTLLCLFFDDKVDKISAINTDNEKEKVKNIPIYFYKKHIKDIINNNKNKDNSSSSEQFGIFLQSLFKTASNITILPNKISKNFSVKFEGEIYFIFCYFSNPNKECSGFFAVMKGKNFNFHKMLEKLNPKYPEIKITFKEVEVNKTYENPENFNCGIKQEKDGLHIIAPLSNKFVRHVLHGGGTELIDKYGKLFPFIDYHIPLWKYIEKQNKIANMIKIISLSIIIFFGIHFLHISLFGFKDKISFKSKMMILIIISSIFPFGIFSLCFYTLNEYEKIINKLQIQQYVETALQQYTNDLDKYLVKLEANLYNSSTKLSEIYSKQDINEFINYFYSIGDNIPISYDFLFFNPVPKKLKNICIKNKITKRYPSRISKMLLNEDKDAVFEQYTEITFNNAKEKKILSREPQDSLKIMGNEFRNAALNDFLANDGKLKKNNRVNAPSFYIFHFIYDYSKNNEIIGLFFANFESKPILGDFISNNNLAKNDFKEKKGKYLIDYAFLPTEDSGTASIWDRSGNITEEIKKFCIQNPTSETINNYSKDKIIIKKRNQLIPHLAVATITNLEKNNDVLIIAKLILSIIAYLLLILYFANTLLDYLIIEPVIKLATNARAIARGGEDWNTEINSGDEFEDLNNNFKNLVAGLKERNILKSYVSEDAFSDIKGSSETNLKPGGEYIEATIVFSAIKDYDKLSQEITPQESIQLLSKFMSLAEKASKKYGGSIDKIIGDTIMLVFRNNPTLPSHGLRAAQASLELVENAKANKLPNLYTGIASGKVITGKIGSYSGKLDFTVIGNPVNSAARFKAESKNGTEQTGIIISGTTIGLTKGRAKVKFLRRVAIKGKSRKYNIYELVGIRD